MIELSIDFTNVNILAIALLLLSHWLTLILGIGWGMFTDRFEKALAAFKQNRGVNK